MVAKTLLLRVLSIVATGTLFVLCLPLADLGPLAFVALVPLLVATRGRGFIYGFLGGIAAVFLAAWLSTQGLFYRIARGDANDEWIYTGYGIFGFSFAIAFALWADRSTLRYPAWWFAAIATLLESVLLVELPSHLALSQYRNAAMVQLASLGGIWLVTFLVWWANFAIAEALRSEDRTKRLVPPGLAIAASLLLSPAWLPVGGATRRLAALQNSEADEAGLRRMQASATHAGASLVVWPEFGGMMFAPGGDTSGLRKVGGAPFVTSFPDDASPLPHNTAALFARGTESSHYYKRKLFGAEKRMHTPGVKAVVAGDVGLNVCFDSCFPAVVRDTARLGASVIALPTTDPSSTYGFISAIHAAYTPFRAAENGVAFVRADSDAYSMIVDSRGRIVAEAAPGVQTLTGVATVGPRWTLYRTLGDWFLYACGALVAYGIWNRRRSAEAGQTPTA